MIPFLDLKVHYESIREEVDAAMREAMDSGRYIMGPQLAAFEEEFARYLGVSHVVGVASGTDAICLGLRACGVGEGDEVITAPNTCVPTAAGIVASGAALALADVNSATLTLDPASVEAAITPDTRALVPVHLYGHPCDMDALNAIAAKHEIALVTDCAHAHGAMYNGRMCGNEGAAAAFSFYPSKNLGAFGDGGAVATNDNAVAQRLRELRNYGETERYFHSTRGVNSRLDELQAAVLRVKLRHLDEWNERRRAIAAYYDRRLSGAGLVLPVQAAWARHVYHLYVVRTANRAAFQERLKTLGIGALQHYPVPIHFQGAFRELPYKQGAFPNAEQACKEVLSLPLHPHLSDAEIEAVADAVIRATA